MTELQVIRATIPMQYKKVQEAMIEYKRCQNLNQLIKKEKHMKELFADHLPRFPTNCQEPKVKARAKATTKPATGKCGPLDRTTASVRIQTLGRARVHSLRVPIARAIPAAARVTANTKGPHPIHHGAGPTAKLLAAA